SDAALRRSTPLHEASLADAPARFSSVMNHLGPVKDFGILTAIPRFR
ncbi:MAG: hypothetical protein H6R41_1814, partial [Deltaproteobacteria bacterium]|nr:hypothetical protein [Deltaproteobacteria bacterium]MBS1245277.1 hypothetical protein [Deltaproteobacteria bacterium]